MALPTAHDLTVAILGLNCSIDDDANTDPDKVNLNAAALGRWTKENLILKVADEVTRRTANLLADDQKIKEHTMYCLPY